LGERKKPKVVSRSFVLRMFSPMASAEVAAAVGAVGAGASSFEQPAKPRLSNAVKRENVKVDLRVVFIVTEGKGMRVKKRKAFQGAALSAVRSGAQKCIAPE
jgi:hypothetical protein